MTFQHATTVPHGPLDLLSSSALGWATAFSLALIPVTLLLLAADPRVLDGEALWLKPLKFQISMAVLCGTLVLAVLAAGPGAAASPWVRVPAVAAAATAFYELTFLGLQAARGTRSHFNVDTAFDRIGGTAMAAGAGVLVLGAALIGAAILVWLIGKGRGSLDEPLLLALGLGLVLGGVLGGQTGGAIGANHGPFVGVHGPSDPAVPLMGWSLAAGDLRIAHFLGLHAMQALPLLALALRPLLPASAVSSVVILGAVAWTTLTLATMTAAQSGLPVGRLLERW